MTKIEELVSARSTQGQEAIMQKLAVKGHLLIGADLSARHINDFLLGLGNVCGMNIFNGPHVKTPVSYDLDTFRRLGNRPPEDVNGSVMWDDSGAQIYVYPNKANWFTLEAHTCKRFDYRKALMYTYEELGVKEDMMYSTSTAETNTDWQQFTLPNGKALNPEIQYLPQIDRLFDIDSSNPNMVITAGLVLRQVMAKAIRAGCGRRVADSYTSKQVRELQDIHGRFEVATDNKFIDDLTAGKALSPDQYPLQPTFDRLARMEAIAAGMQKGRQVLHIGTGWPGTAIGLYRQFGIPVICVEKDPEFAERSIKGLKELDLLGRDKLQVVCADGTKLNTNNYQAVIVSAMVPNEDKKIIIQNMRELASGGISDPVLILRTPANRAGALLYQDLSDDILRNQFLTKISDTGLSVGNMDPLRSLVFKVREMAFREANEHWLRLARTRLQCVILT